MKQITTILLLSILFRLEAQNVYFKSVDLDKANDSITALVDSISDLSIRFSQHSYWASRADTTTKPNLFNFYMYLYKDSSDNSYGIIVSPYFIFGPYKSDFHALDFFELYQNELLKTDIRPDERDLVVDTSYFIQTGIPLNDTTKYLGSLLPHRGYMSDGVSMYVVLTNEGETFKIKYDRRLLDPDDFYYQYNSSKPFYTLTLLLKDDSERLKGVIEWDVELAQQGVLTEEERIQWMLDRLPERQKELAELKKALTEELKNIKRAKTK